MKSCDLFRVGRNAVLPEDVSKKLDARLGDLSFLYVDGQACTVDFVQSLKQSTVMVCMAFPEDDDVITYVAGTACSTDHCLHGVWENFRSTVDPKYQSFILEQSCMSGECGNIPGLQSNKS